MAARCANDSFDRARNPNYEEGGAHNRLNLHRRNSWSSPLIAPGLFDYLYRVYDPVSGQLVYRTAILYPTYGQDTRPNQERNPEQNPSDVASGRYELWLPNDTYADRVTEEMRRASPSAFTANQQYVNQNTPADVILLTLCEEGCFSGGTALEAEAGSVGIMDLASTSAPRLLTLGQESSQDRFAFAFTPVSRWLSDLQPAAQEFVEIRTEGGGQLDVTPSHPVLLADGTLRRAGELVVGATLVRDDGSRDVVNAVGSAHRVARSYNVELEPLDVLSNLVSANGFIVGSQRLQVENDSVLSRDIFRSALQRNEIPLKED